MNYHGSGTTAGVVPQAWVNARYGRILTIYSEARAYLFFVLIFI
jgi:hypothetical protein